MKRTNKIGLKEAYGSDEDVQNVVQCLVSLPLLPPEEIVAAIDDVEAHVLIDSSNENQLRQRFVDVCGCPKNMSRLLNYFYFVMFVHCFYFFIVLFVCLSPLFSCVSFSLLATVFLINLS